MQQRMEASDGINVIMNKPSCKFIKGVDYYGFFMRFGFFLYSYFKRANYCQRLKMELEVHFHVSFLRTL